MTVAVVLAAGRSTRMGRPKALLERDGEPLVRRTARLLAEAGADRVLVVVADDAVARACDGVATPVRNSDPDRGMLWSLFCALERVPGDAALAVCPCDLPGLTADDVRSVLGVDRPDAIVVPVFDGKRGHPVRFGPKIASDIRTLDPAREGLNALAARHPDRVVAVEAGPGAVTDVDTWDEWTRFVGTVCEEAKL